MQARASINKGVMSMKNTRLYTCGSRGLYQESAFATVDIDDDIDEDDDDHKLPLLAQACRRHEAPAPRTAGTCTSIANPYSTLRT